MIKPTDQQQEREQPLPFGDVSAVYGPYTVINRLKPQRDSVLDKRKKTGWVGWGILFA